MSIIRDFVELVRNVTANLNLKVDKSSVTSGNNGNTVVSRDGGGSFSAGTITAALNGTAANANKLLNMNWAWSGQGGQPAWLWGGSDGTNVYVYNPSNFSVNYANSAGVANSISAATAGAAYSGLNAGDIGTYAYLHDRSSATYEAGTLVSGSSLNWGDQDSYGAFVGYGTWMCMGRINNIGVTIFLRKA